MVSSIYNTLLWPQVSMEKYSFLYTHKVEINDKLRYELTANADGLPELMQFDVDTLSDK